MFVPCSGHLVVTFRLVTRSDSRWRDRVGMLDPVRRSALAGRSLGVMIKKNKYSKGALIKKEIGGYEVLEDMPTTGIEPVTVPSNNVGGCDLVNHCHNLYIINFCPSC